MVLGRTKASNSTCLKFWKREQQYTHAHYNLGPHVQCSVQSFLCLSLHPNLQCQSRRWRGRRNARQGAYEWAKETEQKSRRAHTNEKQRKDAPFFPKVLLERERVKAFLNFTSGFWFYTEYEDSFVRLEYGIWILESSNATFPKIKI